jgi:alpha-beta hydrolase superfamily lysophospholipase
MQNFDFDWQSADNLKIVGRCWLPHVPIKAMICTIHGFAEHIGRYEHVAKYMNAQGYGFIGFDQRGHGKSEGKRGHTPNYHFLIDDVGSFLALVKEKFKDVPLFLYGHSMGGNIVANFVLRTQPNFLQGVIITSPWLKLSFSPPAIKLWLGTLMEKIYPKFTEKSDLNVRELSHDAEIGKAYLADPLVHNSVTAKMFVEITKAGLFAIQNAKNFALPLLLMHGTGDNITSHKATEEFAHQIAPNWITLQFWDGMKHELHNETIKMQVLDKMNDWISQRLKLV